MNDDIINLLTKLNISLKEIQKFKAADKKYYYTYLIIPTNINSSMYMKVYFGMKIAVSLKTDNYTGSGRKITKYINKYPHDYYKKYLGFYNNIDELRKAEYDLIHPHLNKEYCLNLKEGGGNSYLSEETKRLISKKITGNKVSEETKEKIKNTLKAKVTDEFRKRMSDINKGENNPMYHKNAEDFMSPEAIKEKRKKQSLNLSGKNNGMYGIHVEDLMTTEAIKEKRHKQSLHMKGRKYMHKGNDLIYINPEDIPMFLQQGYILGRKRK